jgi:(2Fe-2S) ferredoxin
MDNSVNPSVDQAAATLKPYYKSHVFCCINERAPGHRRGCCKERGGAKLRDYMKTRARELKINRVRINQSGCLDRCELGPVLVIYPEGIWYTYQTKEDVDEILQTHLIDGQVVSRLLLDPDRKDPKPLDALTPDPPGRPSPTPSAF